MNILTVAPGPRFSTYDTFLYYSKAFASLGHKVAAFNYHDHYAYHATALANLEDGDAEDLGLQSRAIMLAAEDLISRIARTTPDLVFIVSGIALPVGVWEWLNTFRGALKRQFITMVLFTESPYIDETQYPILDKVDIAATTDKASLDGFLNTNEHSLYVRHAYEPSVHRPMPMSAEHMADVFMVGTGFPERINLLKGIDWTGIDFRLFGGNWSDLGDELDEYYTPEFLDNEEEVPLYYSNSTVSLNIYRTAKWPGENVLHVDPGLAYSVSPRCYEIMGCGGFLLTDPRPELLELFEAGRDLVVFDGSTEDLEDKIRYYLYHPRQRDKIASSGMMAVAEHTYMNRAAEILKYIDDNWRVL